MPEAELDAAVIVCGKYNQPDQWIHPDQGLVWREIVLANLIHA